MANMEFLVGEDAPLVAHYGYKWVTMTDKQKRAARVNFFFMCLRPEQRNKLTELAVDESDGDTEAYIEILERELGINGYQKGAGLYDLGT